MPTRRNRCRPRSFSFLVRRDCSSLRCSSSSCCCSVGSAVSCKVHVPSEDSFCPKRREEDRGRWGRCSERSEESCIRFSSSSSCPSSPSSSREDVCCKKSFYFCPPFSDDSCWERVRPREESSCRCCGDLSCPCRCRETNTSCQESCRCHKSSSFGEEKCRLCCELSSSCKCHDRSPCRREDCSPCQKLSFSDETPKCHDRSSPCREREKCEPSSSPEERCRCRDLSSSSEDRCRCGKSSSPCREREKCEPSSSPEERCRCRDLSSSSEDRCRCGKSSSPCRESDCHKESSSSEPCERKDIEERKFLITVVPKQGHPNEHRILGTDDAFAVNGRKGAVLHLHRGKTYYFGIAQAPDETGAYPHRLYFTRDLLGGPQGLCSDSPSFLPEKLPDTPDPMANGVAALVVDEHTPKYFYYQDTKNPGLGGQIIVHG